MITNPELAYSAAAAESAVARLVISCSVRTVVSMSWISNWPSSRTVGPAMYSRRLRYRACPSAVRSTCALPPISASTSFAAAAATPLAGGTAQVVLSRLALGKGTRLLVLGASGGVGLFLLQLTAAAGIETIAVGRRAMHQQMLGLGAAWCIDYTGEDVAQRAVSLGGGPVDAIADLVGGQSLAAAIPALRPGGQIAAIATPELDLDPLLDANITFHGVLIGDDGQRTRALAAHLAEATLRPVISHLLPLSQAVQAHHIVEGKHAGGKIVLAVAS